MVAIKNWSQLKTPMGSGIFTRNFLLLLLPIFEFNFQKFEQFKGLKGMKGNEWSNRVKGMTD